MRKFKNEKWNIKSQSKKNKPNLKYDLHSNQQSTNQLKSLEIETKPKSLTLSTSKHNKSEILSKTKSNKDNVKYKSKKNKQCDLKANPRKSNSLPHRTQIYTSENPRKRHTHNSSLEQPAPTKAFRIFKKKLSQASTNSWIKNEKFESWLNEHWTMKKEVFSRVQRRKKSESYMWAQWWLKKKRVRGSWCFQMMRVMCSLRIFIGLLRRVWGR